MNIVIVSPGMAHDGNTLKEKSLGGSETAAIQLAEAIARRKDPFGRLCNVVVFSPCEKPMEANGVRYLPIQAAGEHMAGADIDVLIVSRALEALMRPHSAKVCLLWCHDLAIGRQAEAFRGISYQVDRVLLMSQFQAKQYTEVYGLPEEGMEVIRNGIDLGLFPAPYSVPREPGLMVYGARPERGLENLVRPGGIMDELLKRKIPANLAVAFYDNTTEQMRPFYESLWARCRELPNVRLLGSLTKKQLYDLYSRAWLYVYPTPGAVSPNFAEISCISAMEAAACGLPFLTNDVGALGETVGKGTGIVVRGAGTDEQNNAIFVREIGRLLKDEAAWKRLSGEAYKRGATLSWDSVAETLVSLGDSIMREKSADPAALYKHFYRLSEIDGCRKLEEMAGGAPIDLCEREQARVKEGWAFTESPEAYRAQYEKVDAGASVDHYATSENEPRLQMLLQFLRAQPGKFKQVLDYGCWIGHQTIRVANELGKDAQVMGVDVTKRNIDLAQECRAKYAKHGNVEFKVYDEMSPDDGEMGLGKWRPVGGFFDLVICNEVLEHVVDPHALIDRLEGWCMPGGTIFLTTPAGAWEYLSYETFPHRCHLRHFEQADLMDLFGEKKGIQIYWRASAQDDRGLAIGHHYVSYTMPAEGEPAVPTGRIDWNRKLAYQAPRQTLSVCVIAKNAEGLLGRMLKSIAPVADEIVLADTGSTDHTRAIAERHGAKVIEGPNPLDPKVEGFEEARNVSIAGAKGSWVLWIDCDEELLNPAKLHKYLRQNVLSAYGVQQHHLSVDPPMSIKPDIPMRLFRNGCGIRFFGIVHEHPETEINKGVGLATILSDTWIAHDGYLTEDVRRSRFLRNIDLVVRDRKKYPERILGHFLWLRDLIHLCRYRMEQMNGRGPDPQMLQWAAEAQRLYENRYLENPHDPMSPDALQYYSEANRILGAGVPLRFRMQVANSPEREIAGQFRTAELAARFMSAVVKVVAGQIEQKYF